jgi:2-C-methyl-D-erythritol 2,4-cyclodiphosphate synthase
MMNKIRVGFGFDVHRLVEGRQLWLGGIQLSHEQGLGLLGHSDADVLIHALCDALLGAAALRDIGFHFPDTGAEYEGIDSKILLRNTLEIVRAKGYEFGNADITVCVERPKLNFHIPKMQICLSEVMKVESDDISIKATTSEKMGYVGREEGIAAYATVLIYKNE